MNKNQFNQNLYNNIADILQKARASVVKAVNYTMVYAYYEVGRVIIEDEQNGARRAEYGKSVLIALSKRLTQEFGKGFSKSNLEQMRQFYMTYTNSQTLSVESAEIAYANPQTMTRKSKYKMQLYHWQNRGRLLKNLQIY